MAGVPKKTAAAEAKRAILVIVIILLTYSATTGQGWGLNGPMYCVFTCIASL